MDVCLTEISEVLKYAIIVQKNYAGFYDTSNLSSFIEAKEKFLLQNGMTFTADLNEYNQDSIMAIKDVFYNRINCLRLCINLHVKSTSRMTEVMDALQDFKANEVHNWTPVYENFNCSSPFAPPPTEAADSPLASGASVGLSTDDSFE